MASLRYVVDESGVKVGVYLDIADYNELMEQVEELEAIRAYDAAVASGEQAVPFEQAITQIERDRE